MYLGVRLVVIYLFIYLYIFLIYFFFEGFSKNFCIIKVRMLYASYLLKIWKTIQATLLTTT